MDPVLLGPTTLESNTLHSTFLENSHHLDPLHPPYPLYPSYPCQSFVYSFCNYSMSKTTQSYQIPFYQQYRFTQGRPSQNRPTCLPTPPTPPCRVVYSFRPPTPQDPHSGHPYVAPSPRSQHAFGRVLCTVLVTSPQVGPPSLIEFD